MGVSRAGAGPASSAIQIGPDWVILWLAAPRRQPADRTVTVDDPVARGLGIGRTPPHSRIVEREPGVSEYPCRPRRHRLTTAGPSLCRERAELDARRGRPPAPPPPRGGRGPP